jgi:tripartite-type tricarboxylate transporter receptor subunit TctC
MIALHIFAVLAAAIIAAPTTTRAQDWPSRPIRIIVPFPAGGSTDVAARVIGQYMSKSLGQQVYVENKSGANGNIGIEAGAKSTPDGYTLLLGTDAVTSNPHVFKMNIDPLKELVPVILLTRQPIVLAVHPSMGVNSLAELIAVAKKQPGLRYATGSGFGSQQHIVVQWFAQLAGLSLEQVPYRGGAPALNDLIAGHMKIGSLGATPLIPHYKAGTLRLLAQTMEARSPILPDVPTFQEAGVKGLVIDQWTGVFAQSGTPAKVTTHINAEINKALADAAVRESLLQSAQEPVGGTAEYFARFVHEDFDKFARLVRELNIMAN